MAVSKDKKSNIVSGVFLHTIQFEISKPTEEGAFEDMCAHVFGVIFNDPLPQVNGRRGQKQSGVDVFVTTELGRVGIQCKRYVDGGLKLKHIITEIERAERGNVAINKLIVATTAASDSKLVAAVHALSDQRVAGGKFPIELQSWQDICRQIRIHGCLQSHYAPNAPGAIFYEQKQQFQYIRKSFDRIEERIPLDGALPVAHLDSANKLISALLDKINELLKTCRYRDALEDLGRIGQDFAPFDEHQKARWYLQRAFCHWNLGTADDAANDFLKAADLYPDDEKMAAAKIRGLLLRENVEAALDAGAIAKERYPASLQVWLAYTNARLVQKEPLEISDIPSSLRDDADILQFLAWGRRNAGDLPAAVSLSSRALDSPSAGFFARGTSLIIALENAIRNPIASTFGLINASDKGVLEKAVSAFIPTAERLWAIQSPQSVTDISVHLAYAYLVLGRPNTALESIQEARIHGYQSSKLIGVELDALRKLGNHDELLKQGRANLSQLADEALVDVAEVAAENGDVSLVEQVIEASKQRSNSQIETLNVLRAIRWAALWRSSERPKAVNEVLAETLETSDNLSIVCVGARILSELNKPNECARALTRAEALVKADETPGNRFMLAELLFSTNRLDDARKWYETLITQGTHSDLHNRLLCCYVRTGNRRKARQLIESFPDGWVEDDGTRSLAIELGQKAGDWQFLEPLAEVQLRNAPAKVASWLFQLVVGVRIKRLTDFLQIVDIVPEVLEGTFKQITQLASLELRYGQQAKGMRRLYRMFRGNLDSSEAASNYMIGLLATTERLPGMEEVLTVITPGSSVTLTKEDGSSLVLTIDPDDVEGLPNREEFKNSELDGVKEFIGAGIGDEITLPGAFHTARQFRVKDITSAYRRLLHIAQEKISHSLTFVPNIMSVPTPKTEHGIDLSYMHAVLKQTSEHQKQVLHAYEQGPITLGICARMLGRNSVEVINGWPCDGPSLFVCLGTMEEREYALTILASNQAKYVVDAATLAELASLKCLHALASLPKVYVSTLTRDLLENILEEARYDRSVGQAVEIEGQLSFIEHAAKDHARKVAYLEEIVVGLEQYCEVVPAYGPDNLPDEFFHIEDVLEAEEHSVLLLAAERGAHLVLIDGRLRSLGQVMLGLSGVWPQVVLMHAIRQGCLDPGLYSVAIVKQFLWNRTFVSLGGQDLSVMCWQGDAWLQRGIQQFKCYLASPTLEFSSGMEVVFEFLEATAVASTQLGAFGEILKHILEAAFRHRDCPTDFIGRVSKFLRYVIKKRAGPQPFIPALGLINKMQMDVQLRYFLLQLKDAWEWSQQPVETRAVNVMVLMISQPPTLIMDRTVLEKKVKVEQDSFQSFFIHEKGTEN